MSSPARAALSAARLLTAVRMRHPHVTTVYAARLRPPHMNALTAHAWLTHDWCAGGSLRAASEQGLLCAPCIKAPLAPLLALLRGVAEGLAAMHAARLTLSAPLWDCVLLQVRSACVLELGAPARIEDVGGCTCDSLQQVLQIQTQQLPTQGEAHQICLQQVLVELQQVLMEIP